MSPRTRRRLAWVPWACAAFLAAAFVVYVLGWLGALECLLGLLLVLVVFALGPWMRDIREVR